MFLPGPFSNEAPTGKAHLKQCEQMTLTRRQKRLCRREPGLAETLRDSVRLSLLECRYQFRNERWNCSLDGRGSLLKRGEPGGLRPPDGPVAGLCLLSLFGFYPHVASYKRSAELHYFFC